MTDKPDRVTDSVVDTAVTAILDCLRDDDETSYTRGFNSGVRAAEVVARQALEALTTRSQPGEDAVERAARDVCATAFTLYRKADGSMGSIEGDDGEQCFIVPHDEIVELRAALNAADLPEEGVEK